MGQVSAAKNNWMIYGANGYSGELIARLARKVGLRPVLAGRNREEIRKLALELGTPFRVFDLESPVEVFKNLEDMQIVLHCAGPFAKTAAPMVQAALTARTHYIDITGEIPVFEYMQANDPKAKEKGIMLLPGAGFDIVPTDCVAAKLHETMPDATILHLTFTGLGGISGGTFRSAVGMIDTGGQIRKNGKIISVPLLSLRKDISFEGEISSAYSIPWGDVFTAYYSTGIENIEVYTPLPVPDWIADAIAGTESVQDLLASPLLKGALENIVGAFIKGPDEESRRSGKTIVIGEVWNHNGEKASVKLTAREGYAYTTESAIAAVRRVLKGEFKPGFMTPSLAFGWRFALEVSGTEIRERD